MASKFSEFGLRYAVRLDEIAEGVLKSDYEFRHNIFIEDDTVWWTHDGGGRSGSSFDHFLTELRLDNDFAFGPPKKQAGWPIAKLESLNAIGAYGVRDSGRPKKPERTRRRS